MEVINVEIDPSTLLGDYATAFVNECYRNAPELVDRLKLTAEEVVSYSEYLAYQRVLCVHSKCEDYRKLKSLWIPVWIQYNLAMIGKVIMYDRGLTILPQMKEVALKFDQAYAISEKIAYFKDYVQLVHDAMPRSEFGDKDVMSTAVIAGYVRAEHRVEHVASTYVTAFMNMKLREEAAMQVLYRVQYDDLEFIRAALISGGGLF